MYCILMIHKISKNIFILESSRLYSNIYREWFLQISILDIPIIAGNIIMSSKFMSENLLKSFKSSNLLINLTSNLLKGLK